MFHLFIKIQINHYISEKFNYYQNNCTHTHVFQNKLKNQNKLKGISIINLHIVVVINLYL